MAIAACWPEPLQLVARTSPRPMARLMKSPVVQRPSGNTVGVLIVQQLAVDAVGHGTRGRSEGKADVGDWGRSALGPIGNEVDDLGCPLGQTGRGVNRERDVVEVSAYSAKRTTIR